MSDPRSEFISALRRAIKEFGIEGPTREQINKMADHYAFLLKWNRKVNLTRIVEPREAARLHYAESLFGIRFLGDARAALDIGSGAGFPAIPMAIVKPDLQVTALEPSRKKAIFLEEAKAELELANLSVARARIEGFDIAGYDLLTVRALPRAAQLLVDLAASLRERQRLMLFCTDELLAELERHAARALKVEARRIPGSRSRLVAIFSRAAA